MGHQHHFLSRLDRVDMPQVELALELYRDHRLVRFLLRHLTLPEGAERVAISLADPVQGPFLIVTREGRFVTCLAEGMKPGRLPIVTRERLDGIAAKHGDMRARMQAGRALAGTAGGTGKLLLRLYEAGDEISREEIVALSGLAPLLYRELLRLLSDLASDLCAARESIHHVLRRTDKPRAMWRALLESYWKGFHCSAHLTVLTASYSRPLLEKATEARRQVGTFFTRGLFEHARVGPAVKALWSVAKIGRPLLPNYKEAYAGADHAMGVVETAAALAALGHRHAQARAEVRKALAALPRHFGRDPADVKARKFSTAIVRLAEEVFGDAEIFRLMQAQMGAEVALAVGKGRPRGDSLRFEREEDVPEELALALAVNTNDSFFEKIASASMLFVSLPWSARAKPEDLYLPADFIRATHVPWTPDTTLELFRDEVRWRKSQVRKPPEGPTRNGPCGCGSGKKYKRCCAAVE